MMTDHYIVKVCGMRDADNIREVEQCSMLNDPLQLCWLARQECSIDWMGFIFWPKSSRFVSQVPEYLPEHCQRVGVFVDASIGDIMSTVDMSGQFLLQSVRSATKAPSGMGPYLSS